MSARTVTGLGRKFVTRWEGSRSRAYRCPAGKLTIGVGHLLTTSEREGGFVWLAGEPVSYARGLTPEQIDQLLAQDLADAEAAVAAAIEVELEPHELDALASFTFNLGAPRLRRSTLRRKLNAGDRESVPSELAKWVRAGGKVLRGLVRRREAEGRLFAMGAYL